MVGTTSWDNCLGNDGTLNHSEAAFEGTLKGGPLSFIHISAVLQQKEGSGCTGTLCETLCRTLQNHLQKIKGPPILIKGPRDKIKGPCGKIMGPLIQIKGPRDIIKGPRGKIKGPLSSKLKVHAIKLGVHAIKLSCAGWKQAEVAAQSVPPPELASLAHTRASRNDGYMLVYPGQSAYSRVHPHKLRMQLKIKCSGLF